MAAVVSRGFNPLISGADRAAAPVEFTQPRGADRDVSIPSLAGQTARPNGDDEYLTEDSLPCFNPLISGADRAAETHYEISCRPPRGFNPLISGADRAAGDPTLLSRSTHLDVSIPSLAGQTARPMWQESFIGLPITQGTARPNPSTPSPVSIPSLAGQTARPEILAAVTFNTPRRFNPLISGADRAADVAREFHRTPNHTSFNPLISGADRAAKPVYAFSRRDSTEFQSPH